MKMVVLLLATLSFSAWAADDAPVLKNRPVTLLTNGADMTVYVFDDDTPGVSNCNGGCASLWPPVEAPDQEFKAPFSVITRANGKKQMAYKNRPLYTFANDGEPGDTAGDNFNKKWHIIHP